MENALNLTNGENEYVADKNESGKCEPEHTVATCSSNDDEGEDTNEKESANCEKVDVFLIKFSQLSSDDINDKKNNEQCPTAATSASSHPERLPRLRSS